MRFLRRLLASLDALQAVLSPSEGRIASIIDISDKWHVLGPFSIGTREAAWGADSLERFGGFHTLHELDSKQFPSSFTFNGTTTWSEATAEISSSSSGVEARLTVAYPAVDWHTLQQAYGWAALQWQGWARGQIYIRSDSGQLVNIYLDQILELWIDDQHFYGGDLYSFHRSSLTLFLEAGAHQVDIRLIRDVRSMGGTSNIPAVQVALSVRYATPGIHRSSEVLFADRLESSGGPLASTLASVLLRNANDEDVHITGITTKRGECKATLLTTQPLRLVSGQQRAVAFNVDCIPGTSGQISIGLDFHYQIGNHQRTYFVWLFPRPAVLKREPHIFTFLHPGGMASYAILRAPASHCKSNGTLPILLALHGAGVDVQSDAAKHALDAVADICAWTLLPSGSTIWSGDDWHNWGWSDVQAAIDSIPGWIEQTDWTGPGVDTTKWLVTGHSNGGQGVWYALTHHPDKIIAASPISGYSSIQNYVPYTMWQPTEPARTGIVQAQLNSYRHELLLENSRGIPVLQQHGEADDNVPAYHSRLMHGLLDVASSRSTYIEYAGQPHWWDGVMTTEPLSLFYKQHISESRQSEMNVFTLTTADPGSTSGKRGVRILGTTPGLLGRVQATLEDHCALTTTHVTSLSIETNAVSGCMSLTVDGQAVATKELNLSLVLDKGEDHSWHPRSTSDHCRRSAKQSGGLEAILRTNGAFQIVEHSPGSRHTALQTASNLLQYYNADAELSEAYEAALEKSGNIISIAVGDDLPDSSLNCPANCRFASHNSQWTMVQADRTSFLAGNDAIVAAAYLRPLPAERLELVLWASDQASLAVSARLLPLLTGTGLPDFVFATKMMLAHGLEGVQSLGFLDHAWCPASTSFLPSTNVQSRPP